MIPESDFKTLARRAYISYHQDGLIDVLIGWMVFSFGIYLLLDSSAIIFLAWLPILYYVNFKNKLTVPRLGYVKFNGIYSQTKRTKLGLVLSTILALSLLTVTVLVLAKTNPIPTLTLLRGNGLAIYGVAVALLLLVSGVFSGVWRLSIYGLLCVVMVIIGIISGSPVYVPFILLGLVILLTGTILMILFIRKYPLASKGGDRGSE